jgi:hypothetical protein
MQVVFGVAAVVAEVSVVVAAGAEVDALDVGLCGSIPIVITGAFRAMGRLTRRAT